VGTSKYTEATRPQLAAILKAWCLMVEFKALPKTTLEIEKALMGGTADAGASDLRQWDRWKSGQLPTGNELKYVNNLAISAGWVNESLSTLLIDAYLSRSGTQPQDAAKCGWDQMASLDATAHFAISNKLDDLESHCQSWWLLIDGPYINPDPNKVDKKAIDDWLDSNSDQYALDELDDLKESIQIYLDRAIVEAFRAGYEDPYPLIKKCLKESQKSWPDVRKLLEKDRSTF
jgi:hypothetical protein